jgi:hypothetical protein
VRGLVRHASTDKEGQAEEEFILVEDQSQGENNIKEFPLPDSQFLPPNALPRTARYGRLVCSEEPRADLEGAVAGLATAATATGGGGVGITSAAAAAAIEHTGQNQASDGQGDSDREGDGDVDRVRGSRRRDRRHQRRRWRGVRDSKNDGTKERQDEGEHCKHTHTEMAVAIGQKKRGNRLAFVILFFWSLAMGSCCQKSPPACANCRSPLNSPIYVRYCGHAFCDDDKCKNFARCALPPCPVCGPDNVTSSLREERLFFDLMKKKVTV